MENSNDVNKDEYIKYREHYFWKSLNIKGFSMYLFWLMMICVLGVMLNPSLQYVIGPILACCFSYLYFHGSKALITAIIICANDSLQCIFLGKIAFPYLLFLLFVVGILNGKRKISISYVQFIAGIILIIKLFNLYYYDIIGIKGFFYTLTFICAAGQCIKKVEEREIFFRGIAISVTAIAVHACITGGVIYYELGEFSQSFLRKGILGVGVGDSNISSLLLNIGITCILFDESIKWFWKLIMISINIYAMTITLSTSGLLGVIVVTGGFLILKRNSLPKKLWNIVIIIILSILTINIYMALPESARNVTVDAYIERMEEKLGFLKSGDIQQFTTSRSSIADIKMEYFWSEQDELGFLFGMNSLFVGDYAVPHNTYIDLLLQLGLIGTIVSLSYMLWKLYMSWKRYNQNKLYYLLKIIFLFYFMNLSLYQGNMFALAYICMIMI